MKTSNHGINLIKESEGLRLKPYLDADGYGTIGYGHKILPCEKFTTIDVATAQSLLARDILHCEECINHCVKVTINQNQYDALIDFIYNEGWSHFANSTLLRYLNNDQYKAAANQFGLWVYGNGEVLDGLVMRRSKEKQLFLQP